MKHADKIVHDWPTLLRHVECATKPLVFTNGCFDILHRGHITYLEEASNLGATLIVALNSDHSIQALGKGSDRPINPLEDRMAVIAALGSVDWVTAFDDPTPIDLIRALKPNCLVKGGDWVIEKIVGAEDVLANAGTVHSIPIKYQRSTTALLEQVRNSNHR